MSDDETAHQILKGKTRPKTKSAAAAATRTATTTATTTTERKERNEEEEEFRYFIYGRRIKEGGKRQKEKGPFA